MDVRSNRWKLTAIGMGLVAVTALVTGLVVAGWRGAERPRGATAPPAVTPAAVETPAASPKTAEIAVAPKAVTEPVAPAPDTAKNATATSRPAVKAAPRTVSGVPPQSVIQACNEYAARQTGHAPPTQKDKTIDIVKDAAVGAVGGAAVGALGGAIAGGGKGAGKGAAIGGVLGGGAGTLYGIYAGKQDDEKYRAAYAICMKGRGYTA